MCNEEDIPNKVLMQNEIIRLSNLLDEQYSKELNFRNHCYLRIAYDNSVSNKWDNVIPKPFVKHANDEQLKNVLMLLNSYVSNKQLLLKHNILSLQFRKKL